MENNNVYELFKEYGDDIALGIVAGVTAFFTAGGSIPIALAIGGGTSFAAGLDDYLDDLALDEDMQAALAQIIPHLVAINQTLQDGFAGKDVVAGQLERHIEALRESSLQLYGRMQVVAEESGASDRPAIWDNITTPEGLPPSPASTEIKPMAEQFNQLTETMLALQSQLEARRAEIAAEQAGSSTPTLMTPEELQAAYAPSPEMQARIDAVTESFGRLADPLLPELEARMGV